MIKKNLFCITFLFTTLLFAAEEGIDNIYKAFRAQDYEKINKYINESVVDKKDKRGFFLVHTAVINDDIIELDLLHKYKADLSKKDISLGMAPISLAAYTGKNRALKKLIDLGMDVNSRRDNGNTPIMDAIEAYNLKGIKLLLKAGARVDVKNHTLQTPLDLAKSMKFKEVVDIIKKHKK